MFPQPLGLPVGFLPQFPIQHGSAPVVLAQRLDVLIRQAVQPHQLAVNGFLQRVQRQPPSPILDGLLVLAPFSVDLHQPLERGGMLAPQILLHHPLPILKVGAVSQVEAREELPPRELQGCGQIAPRSGEIALGVCPLPALQATSELGCVHPQALPGGQPRAEAVGAKTVLTDSRPQKREGLAQAGSPVLPVLLPVQQLGQLIAAVTLRGHRQVGKQGHHLAAANLHGDIAETDARGAKKV